MTARQTRGAGLGPSAEQTWIESELPKHLDGVRQRRLAGYEKRGIELVSDLWVRAVDDERGGGRPLYRHDDGRLLEVVPLGRELGARPDAVLVELEPWHLTELSVVDVEVYEVEASRHRAVVEAAEAERLAALAAAEAARRDAPQNVLTSGLDLWTLPELLEQVERTDGALHLHDGRLLVTLPVWPHLIGQPHLFRQAVNQLRPLLVATRLGTTAVTCDLEQCDADAVTVGAGGAYLCEQHRR